MFSIVPIPTLCSSGFPWIPKPNVFIMIVLLYTVHIYGLFGGDFTLVVWQNLPHLHYTILISSLLSYFICAPHGMVIFKFFKWPNC